MLLICMFICGLLHSVYYSSDFFLAYFAASNEYRPPEWAVKATLNTVGFLYDHCG